MAPEKIISMFTTNKAKQWNSEPAPKKIPTARFDLGLSGSRHQTWRGFGGCFNELGWRALSVLDKKARETIFAELFAPETGCRFNLCRLPIGASDYAEKWYSLNDNENDFAMEKFSIERDKKILIPYIKSALKYRPDLQLFASPWSPPSWLKFPNAYNYGKIVWKKKYLDAYALYFLKFLESYKAAGVSIDQIHVQNEPVADQKFPSCLWTGDELRLFIRNYLGPLLEKHAPECEIWLGTLNTDDYNGFVNRVLSDPRARKYIKGVGFQWAGKNACPRAYASWPEVPLMQTENECGNGENSWAYAQYVFDLIQHYISNGVVGYTYWNMILEPKGKSTWGWMQNSMICIDPVDRKVTCNPEFFVMKHFSHFIRPGAVRCGLTGHCASNAVAFENGDGSTVYCINNPFDVARPCILKSKTATFKLDLKAESFNTLVIR